jgi:hypothetical protein
MFAMSVTSIKNIRVLFPLCGAAESQPLISTGRNVRPFSQQKPP